MVLKTRSWSLFTVTSRSSPKDVIVEEGGEADTLGELQKCTREGEISAR